MEKPCTVLFLLLLFSIPGLYAQRIVTGTVFDEEGAAMPGVIIRVEGSATGAVSDLHGHFLLALTGRPPIYLTTSHLGYEAKKILLGEEENLEIRLNPVSSRLDEVVVTGFGSQSRRRLTSAIVSADEKVFEGIPASTIDDALQGRLPGVVFSRGSGALGSAVSIRVRGVASINAGNQPLIVIDGLIFEGMSGFGLGSSGTNPLLNLNPNDIESIEVLKEGAASAIYGSRGSNGVILINTKRGKLNTSSRVNISYYAGFAEPTTAFDLLNGREYAVLLNEAARNAGLTERLDEENQPSTDWFDLITRRAFQQEVSAGVSGGSNTTQYYFGGSYRDEDGYYLDTDLKRYSFRANIDQMISERVRAGLSLNPSLTIMDRASEGRSFHAPNSLMSTPPIVEPYDENGELVSPLIVPPLNLPFSNPLVNLLESDISLTTAQVLLSTYLDYRPWHFLNLRAELGAEYTQNEDLIKYSSRTFYGMGVNGSGRAASRYVLNYNATALATYENSFSGQHAFDLTLGANLTRRRIHVQDVSGINFADDRLLFLGAATTITDGFSGRTDAAFTGFFARANYALANRYLLTLSGRYDGSSRFGSGKRYGFFPAVSAGWILSEEDFFPGEAINFLKLSASIGQSGNGNLLDFASLGVVDIQSYAGDPGFVLDQLENRDLSWEKTTQINGGVDFGLWNNRVSGSLGYFVKNTSDLLLEVPLPGTTGISSSFQNTGRVRNQGFEYALSADLLTGPFRWNLSVNGATLRNEVLELPDNDRNGEEDDILRFLWLFRSGEPMASWYLPRYAGVDPQNGDALFYTPEGGTVPVNPPSSGRAVVGNSIPTSTGGFSNTFGFKGFDLSAFFQFASGHSLYRDEGDFLEINMTRIFNQLRTQLDAWTPENTETEVPQARLDNPNGLGPSTRYLDKAGYLRLKNLQFGYTFKKLGKQDGNLRLYASAQNLLTFTDYAGLDPEANNVDASASTGGAPFFSSPQSRIFILGLNYEL